MRSLKVLLVIAATILLSSCSLQGIYEKLVPENVRTMDEQYVQAVLDKDVEAFRNLQGELSDEDFETLLSELFEKVPSGEVIYNSVVSVENNTTFDGSGKRKIINSSFEIKKGDKFLLINLIYSLDSDGNCCRLVRMNLEDYESSPVKAAIDQAARIGKIIGLVFLGLIVIGLVVLVSYVRRKRRNKEQRTS